MWEKLDNTLNVLGRGLDGAALRQKVLADNIANVDTPGYKAKDVNFYDQLKVMMDESNFAPSLPLAKTDVDHLDGQKLVGQMNVFETIGQVRTDGNNVNIDVEMAKMAENNIYYSTLASTVAKKYKMLDQVITKGGDR